ncbi:ABC transporter [Actinomadura cremea]|nr:ABC transporter [Actinomadura cremea]
MLEVASLGKTYGNGRKQTTAIADVTFSVRRSEFVCVVGPSGCGKTTLLKCISGLMTPSSGRVLLNDRAIDGPPAEMALVFQDYSRSLLPWMTVSGNIRFPLKSRRLPKAEIAERVQEAIDAVGLTSFEDHYPWQLSGGMQQRAAIARALAYRPQILLMDEPFASVDAQTRADLEDTILRVRTEFDITVLLVTHDIDESIYLSDRVVVLAPPPTRVDEIVEVGLPSPRDQITTKELPEFTRLRGHVFRAIKRPAPSTGAAPTDKAPLSTR